MNKDEIIILLTKEVQIEKRLLENAEYFYRKTWNPFEKIRLKFVIQKYVHSYVTLTCILDKIEKDQ